MVSARVLSMQELATYRQSLLIFQVATPFIGLGIGSALLYFLPVNIEKQKTILIESLIVCTLSGTLFASFINLGGGGIIANAFDNQQLLGTMLSISLLMVCSAPNIVINSFLVVLNKAGTLSIYQVSSNLVVGIGVVLSCIYYKDPFSMVEIRVFLLVLSAFAAMMIMFHFVKGLKGNISYKGCAELVSYGLPLSMSMCVGMLSLQLDKLIVSTKTSPEQFVIYSNGAMEIPLIGVITSSICLVMIVPFRKAFNDSNFEDCIGIYHKVAEKISFILLPVMVYFALLSTPFIIFMYSVKYIDSVFPFLLYLLIIPARSLLQGAMAAVGKGKVLLRNSIISLALNTMLTLILVERYGYLGAIISTIIVIYLWDVSISLKEVSSSLKIKYSELYPFKKILKIFICASFASIPFFVVEFTFQDVNSMLKLIVGATVYFPSYVIVGMKFNLFSEEIKSFIIEKSSDIKSKIGRNGAS